MLSNRLSRLIKHWMHAGRPNIASERIFVPLNQAINKHIKPVHIHCSLICIYATHKPPNGSMAFNSLFDFVKFRLPTLGHLFHYMYMPILWWPSQMGMWCCDSGGALGVVNLDMRSPSVSCILAYTCHRHSPLYKHRIHRLRARHISALTASIILCIIFRSIAVNKRLN